MTLAPCPTCRGQRRLPPPIPPRFASAQWELCKTCRGSGTDTPLPERVEGEQA